MQQIYIQLYIVLRSSHLHVYVMSALKFTSSSQWCRKVMKSGGTAFFITI